MLDLRVLSGTDPWVSVVQQLSFLSGTETALLVPFENTELGWHLCYATSNQASI